LRVNFDFLEYFFFLLPLIFFKNWSFMQIASPHGFQYLIRFKFYSIFPFLITQPFYPRLIPKQWWVQVKNFWPRSCQFFVAGFGSGQPFMVWVWIKKISPKNVKFFNFFPFGSKKSLRVWSKSTRVKGRLASYLLQVKSKLMWGRVGAGPISIPKRFWSARSCFICP